MNKTFYIFRHGETDWNLNKRVQGWTDIPLNETGISQAKQLAQKLCDVNFDVIYSSPLARALMTAEIVADRNNCPVITNDGLRERCLGIFEGKYIKPADMPIDTKIDFDATPVLVPKHLVKNPNFVPPHGESHNMFAQRVHTTLLNIAKNTSATTIGISTHSGVMRNIISQTDVISIPIPNTAYYKLTWDGTKFTLADIPDWIRSFLYSQQPKTK